MELSINSYIKKLLKKADYEYDKQTKSWCASVDDLPGAYAQADAKRVVKEQLVEVIEDYILQSNKDYCLFGVFNGKIHQ